MFTIKLVFLTAVLFGYLSSGLEHLIFLSVFVLNKRSRQLVICALKEIQERQDLTSIKVFKYCDSPVPSLKTNYRLKMLSVQLAFRYTLI